MSEKEGPGSTRKSPYIVIIGNPGSGKTTLLASICHYINNQEDFLLRYDLNDKKGINYLNEIWQNTLVKGEFPPGSHQLENVEVPLSFKSVRENVEHNYTFFELPGETISILSDKDETDERYFQLLEYIYKADIAIIAVEAGEAHGEDLSLSIFFQTLQAHGITLPIILVISKWDQLRSDTVDVNEFVKSRMPATYKWLNYGYFLITEMFKFSVGKVYQHDVNNEYGQFMYYERGITSLSYNDSREIFNWLFDYFKKQKTTALEQKLKSSLSRLSREPNNIDLLREIKNIYLELGEKEEAAELDRKLNRLMEKKEFQYNLGKQIVLRQVELQDLEFFGNFKWNFQPGVNVLLGRNGYGKSHLLRLLTALLQKNDEKASEFFEYSKSNPFAQLTVERDDQPETISRNPIVFNGTIGRVPVLALPDMRFMDKSKTVVSISDEVKEEDLIQQWSYHFLYQKPVEGLIRNFLYQLCITYLEQEKTFDLPIFQLIHNVVGKLSDNQFLFHKIESTGRAGFKIDVITEGNENPMPIQKASQGTLSVLAIFGLIYNYLKSVFPGVKEEDLPDQPAIVFIDEIDAHLHPLWQQKIIGLLREHFPNVQFIVTAHSPLVVAGCKEGEVAVLRKAESGFVVNVFEQDFIGYEARELYEKVFAIEEKDDSYLYYNALYPFRGEIEEEIKQLEKEKAAAGKTFSKEKEKKLNQFYDDLYYAKKANEKFEEKQEYSRILIENRKLKAKIKKMESGAQAVK
jgi:predicted ATP-binding protein involved in virulence